MERRRYPGRPRKTEATVAATDAEVELMGDEKDDSKALTTQEAANRLGMSVPWVKLHAGELNGRLTRKGYRFPADLTIEHVRETVTLRSQRGQAVRTAAQNDGEDAAKVFDALDRGMRVGEIVKELRFAPEKVRKLYEEWVKCGQIDEGPLAYIRGEKTPPPPPATAQPGMVSPHGVPMQSFASPLMPPTEPSAPIPSAPAQAKGSGLAATMRAEAQARIAASDAVLDGVKRRMQAETAKFDEAPAAI